MGQPDVSDADIQLETYIRQQCLRHGTYSTEDVRARLAAHRNTGLADEVRRLREALSKTTAACEAFAKWFDNWCPSNRCCASSGLPIHEKALKAINKARAALAGEKNG